MPDYRGELSKLFKSPFCNDKTQQRQRKRALLLLDFVAREVTTRCLFVACQAEKAIPAEANPAWQTRRAFQRYTRETETC